MITIGVFFAAILTLDFQDRPIGAGHRRVNFNYGGLRFSAPCVVHEKTVFGQTWLASDHDNGNCDLRQNEHQPYELPNQGFLGFGMEDFYVDHHGRPFTLLSLAGVGINGTAFTVRSSKGGELVGEVPPSLGQYDLYVLPHKNFVLEGPLWTDITWFQLFNQHEGFGWQPQQGWDDIKYSFNSVYEPSTLELLGIAFAGLLLFGVTRKLRWQ